MSDIKQVIVMRTDLNMRKGKMIAQGAHAAMMFLTYRLQKLHTKEIQPEDNCFWLELSEPEIAWVKGNFKKVVVQVGSEAELLEISGAAKAGNLQSYLCTDSGLTEFNGVATNTCIAIGPDYSEKIDAFTRKLKLL